jgi:pyruvate dehydrogenase E1 component alpha subunit
MPGAVGAGLAYKARRGDVAVSFFGEVPRTRAPSTSPSTSPRSWTLPVVFVCEDNAWAISVPRDKATAIANNSDRAAAYGIPGVLVPDNDRWRSTGAAGEAGAGSPGRRSVADRVKTDRLFGHFEGDPQVYRTKEEMTLLTERDALRAFERRLVDTGVLKSTDAQGVWDRARAEVDEAIAFARSSPYPAPEAALEHVFA